MSKAKQLWLLAGGNGAGKSTFYRTQLESHGIAFVNADILARQLYPQNPEMHSYEAARIAEEIRVRLLLEGRTFCFETVFSHPSKIDFIAQAKTFGYEVILVFIHLESITLNLARVQQRVKEGGHFVPEAKVSEQVPRTLQNIRRTLPLCDRVYLLDNSRLDDPFRKVAELRDGNLLAIQQALPSWAEELLQVYLAEERI